MCISIATRYISTLHPSVDDKVICVSRGHDPAWACTPHRDWHTGTHGPVVGFQALTLGSENSYVLSYGTEECCSHTDTSTHGHTHTQWRVTVYETDQRWSGQTWNGGPAPRPAQSQVRQRYDALRQHRGSLLWKGGSQPIKTHLVQWAGQEWNGVNMVRVDYSPSLF